MIADDLLPLARPIDTLKPLEGNPRKGDVQAVMRSYDRFGQRKPIVALRDGTVIAGNHQLKAARELGWTEIAVVFVEDDEQTAQAFALADNRTADLGTYDNEALADMLKAVSIDPELLSATGYDADDLAGLLDSIEPPPTMTGDLDAVPDKAPAKTIRGDVWLLGNHRLMCGDSTVPTDVEKLMNGAVASLLHADPPYGMGKEKDGVLNDNLYRSKLDTFQMEWWRTFRPHIADNASAYIWGNPEDLWRLWYMGGLMDSEPLTYRNEIVWSKTAAQGMSSDAFRSYAINTERCLFFMVGEQGFNNNADNYWDGWDSVVNYLRQQKNKTGWTISQFKKLAGHSENSGCHWFDKSQWMMPTRETYDAWRNASKGDGFHKTYDELKDEHDSLKKEHDALKQEFYATRAHFDNTHDNMNEVWSFGRVTGEERHGHATPKPVEMMSRIMKSSLREGELCAEPFGGSGSTLMAAHQTGRICYTMELDEHYCDVICKRFQQATGIMPIAEATGNEHDFLSEENQ
jgi:DNA modification methylase